MGTFASPCVGTKEFFKSYQDLEKDGKVMHLRVSNENDPIPGRPPFIFKIWVQTGVNIHMRPHKAAEVKYENTKYLSSHLNPFKIAHGLATYRQRLLAKDTKSGEFVNKDILSKSIEEIYKEYAEL